MLIRATDATHIYDGLDLSRLSGALKPSVVITAEDLARIGTRVPEFFAGDLFCPLRRTPLYLGQPIALLIFEDFDTFDQARLALRNVTVVKYGKETGPLTRQPYAAFRFTRIAGAKPDAPDVYSPFKNGWVSPGVTRTRDIRSGRGCRFPLDKSTPRPPITAKRFAPSLRRSIRHIWSWSASLRRNRWTRCFSSRRAVFPGTTRAVKTSSLSSARSRLMTPRRG
jgi:hypothetical protein